MWGCSTCCSEDPVAASRAPRGQVASLVDDSHFIVSIVACDACGQRFVRVFTEFVDWSGGRDDQYSDTVPVTEAEATALADQGEQVDLRALERLAADRPRLTSSWPRDADRTIRWYTGPLRIRPGH